MAIRTEELQAGFLATLRRFPGMRAEIETLMVESEGWIERLTKEIAEALRNSSVIKLEQPRKSIHANPRCNQR